MAKIM